MYYQDNQEIKEENEKEEVENFRPLSSGFSFADQQPSTSGFQGLYPTCVPPTSGFSFRPGKAVSPLGEYTNILLEMIAKYEKDKKKNRIERRAYTERIVSEQLARNEGGDIIEEIDNTLKEERKRLKSVENGDDIATEMIKRRKIAEDTGVTREEWNNNLYKNWIVERTKLENWIAERHRSVTQECNKL